MSKLSGRFLCVVLLISILGVACDGGSGDEVAELRERVAELEGQADQTPAAGPSSTTAPAPVATSAAPSYDVESVDQATLLAWLDALATDPDYEAAATESCEIALIATSHLGDILVRAVRDALDAVDAVEAGDATLDEAASVFADYTDTIGAGLAVISAWKWRSDLGGAPHYARQVGEAMIQLDTAAINFRIWVLEDPSGVLDSEALPTRRLDLYDRIQELDDLLYPSPSGHC